MIKIDNTRITPPFSHRYANRPIIFTIDWLIALIPCIVWGIYTFGSEYIMRLVLMIAISSGIELLYSYLRKSSYDFKIFIYAVIIALSISSRAPVYVYIVCGALLGGINVLRRLHRIYFTYEPVIIIVALVSFFMFSSQSPVDFTLSGVKSTELTVADLIVGKHNGGFGAVSFIAIFLGYLYLSLRKRIDPMVPIVFAVSMIIGICIFYESTDLVTQLDFISYAVFDGKFIFVAVYMLTLPCVFPYVSTSFGKMPVVLSAVMGVVFSYLLITVKNADVIYLLASVFSLFYGVIGRLHCFITRRVK